MGNILLVTENDEIYNKFKSLLNKEFNNFNSCCNNTSILDLIEISPIDVVLIDDKLENINLNLIIKKIKSKIENVQILLLTDETVISEDISKLISGIILKNYSNELIQTTVNAHIRNKEKLDNLSGKNKDLADSLY